MTQPIVERIATFSVAARPVHLTSVIRQLFKRNILDSLGCAIAALPGPPFLALREQFAGAVVFEPRHATWFTRAADELLQQFQIARVAADPAARGPSNSGITAPRRTSSTSSAGRSG